MNRTTCLEASSYLERLNDGNIHMCFFSVPVIGLLYTHPVPRKSTFRYNTMFNFIPVSFCFFFVNFRVRVKGLGLGFRVLVRDR